MGGLKGRVKYCAPCLPCIAFKHGSFSPPSNATYRPEHEYKICKPPSTPRASAPSDTASQMSHAELYHYLCYLCCNPSGCFQLQRKQLGQCFHTNLHVSNGE